MTFIGSDGSVLDWEDYDFRLYYGRKEGLMFKDIAYSPSISMVENLYICGLRDSKIEALNCYLIFTTMHYDKERFLEYKRLLEDEEHLKEIRSNIGMLSHFVSLGNPCDFRIISQAQKRANFLEDSINERKAEIHRIVTK